MLDRAQSQGRIPGWARPPFFGAKLIFQITGWRMLPVVPFVLLFVARTGGLRDAGIVLGAMVAVLVAAAVAGAIGGLAYSLFAPVLLQIGSVGARLLGVMCVAAYLAPLVLGYAHLSSDAGIVDPGVWLSLSICSLLFGYIVGGLFEDSQ